MRKPTPLKLAVVATGRAQRDIAADLDMHPVTLSRIVNGLWCDTETRKRIAHAVHREVAELWPDHEDASNVPTQVSSNPIGKAA